MEKYGKKIKIMLVFCIFAFFCVNKADASDFHPVALQFFRSSVEHLMNGDFTQAIEYSTQVIRLEPNSAVSYVVRARAFYELGLYDRAIADSTDALRRDRNNIGALNIRAAAHMKRGEFNRAIGDWNTVLRINPEMKETRYNLESARQRRDQRAGR
jgi:tetratricopeptide (TPR) repeat protein